MQESEQEEPAEAAEFSAEKLDDICLWSSLGAYALAWVCVLLVAVPDPWFFAPVVAAAYVGMHFYAIKTHGYCYMFADPYAGPVVTAVLAGMYLALPVLGTARPAIGNVLLGGAVAFFAGHVAVFLYTRILKLSLRRFVANSAGRHKAQGEWPTRA